MEINDQIIMIKEASVFRSWYFLLLKQENILLKRLEEYKL